MNSELVLGADNRYDYNVEDVTPVYKYGTTTPTDKITIKKYGHIAQISVYGIQKTTDGNQWTLPVSLNGTVCNFVLGSSGTIKGYGSISGGSNTLNIYASDDTAVFGGCTFICNQ